MELDISDVSAGVSISTLPKTVFIGWNLGQIFLEAKIYSLTTLLRYILREESLELIILHNVYLH